MELLMEIDIRIKGSQFVAGHTEDRKNQRDGIVRQIYAGRERLRR